jgi:hypothetical protein
MSRRLEEPSITECTTYGLSLIREVFLFCFVGTANSRQRDLALLSILTR